MNKPPRITVIITTFNRSDMLWRAMRSVLRQTFSDFELLILDNASTDGTEKTARSLYDPRIRYLRHDSHSISWARNFGIRESRGEYVGFLDDDDEWLEHKLKDQLVVFDADTEGDIGLVYGPFVHIDQKSGKVFEIIYPSRQDNVYEYVVSHRDTLTGSASNPLLRKQAVLVIGGYDESIRTGEDYEMFLRLAKRYKFAATTVPLVNIYVHQGYRLSYRLEDYLHTEFVVYERHKDFIVSRPRVHRYFLRVIGGKLIRLGRAKEARLYLRQAIRLHVFDVRAWLQFLISLFPKQIYATCHKVILVWHQFIGRRQRSAA